MRNEYLLLGVVLKPQGTQGELKVRPYCDSPERLLRLERVWIKRDGMASIGVVSARVSGGMAYIRLEGIGSRGEAESWRGAQLHVRRDQAEPLGEWRWYIADLIGCRVEDERGAVLGTVSDVLQHGGHDVYVLRVDTGETLIPAVRELILRVDVDQGVITVNRERFGMMAVTQEGR